MDVDAQLLARLRTADAQYGGFPNVDTWNGTVDSEDWNGHRDRLEQARAKAPKDSFEEAVRIATRAAATDTGAIEGLYTVDRGFTFSVATEAATWQAMLDEKGAETRQLIEAQIKAYELVLDVATQTKPITEALIRRIHEEACAPQETYTVYTEAGPQQQRLPKGKYKTQPNHVITEDGQIHAYSPVDMTGNEMHRLIEALKSPTFQSMHPVNQAAYSHYALVAIHPFADGNGRVARALASIWLYRAASVPFLVLDDQKRGYIASLVAADQGDQQRFVRFAYRRSLEAMSLVEEHVRAASLPPPEETLRFMEELFVAREGLTHADVDRIAHSVLNAFQVAFQQRVNELALPGGISIGIGTTSGSVGQAEGYRPPIEGGSTAVVASFSSAPPAGASFNVQTGILVSTSRGSDPAYLLTTHEGHALEVSLDEAYPSISAALELRLVAWVEQLLRQFLERLRSQAEEALRQSGYGWLQTRRSRG